MYNYWTHRSNVVLGNVNMNEILKDRISNESSSWVVPSGLGQCDVAAGRLQHGAPLIWFQAEIQSACRYLLWPWPPVGPKQSIIQPLCCDTQKQMNIGGPCQQKSLCERISLVFGLRVALYSMSSSRDTSPCRSDRWMHLFMIQSWATQPKILLVFQFRHTSRPATIVRSIHKIEFATKSVHYSRNSPGRGNFPVTNLHFVKSFHLLISTLWNLSIY